MTDRLTVTGSKIGHCPTTIFSEFIFTLTKKKEQPVNIRGLIVNDANEHGNITKEILKIFEA